MEFPCKNCTKRKPACHDSCIEYNKAKKEKQMLDERKRNEHKIAYMVKDSNMSTKHHKIRK